MAPHFIEKNLIIENLEVENDRLRKKVEVLEKAVRAVENLITESAGVYWDNPKHPGGRSVGNLMLNRWHEIYGDDSRFNYLQEFFDALKLLKEEKEET